MYRVACPRLKKNDKNTIKNPIDQKKAQVSPANWAGQNQAPECVNINMIQ